MNWLQASWHFLKAVTAAYDPMATEKQYQDRLQDLKEHPGLKNIGVWDVIDFIRDYKHHDFFKIEDTYPLFEKVPDDHVRSNTLSQVVGYPVILNILANKLLNSFKRAPGFNLDYKSNILDEYIYLEKLPISPQLLHQFQLQIINKILTLLERMKEEGDALWFSEHITMLGHFYALTTKFPHSLLDGLFKRFGMEKYLNLRNQPSVNEIKDLKNKQQLTKWDVAILLQRGVFVSGEEFKSTIKKCDPEALEYLRGFLYYWGPAPSEWGIKEEDLQTHLFMLSEDGQPMTDNLDTISWPHQIMILRFDDLSEDEQQKWGPIFADFGIIHH